MAKSNKNKQRTTTIKSRKRPTTNSKNKKTTNNDLRYEVIVLLFVALSLMLIISIYFNLGGSIGAFLNYAFFGTFGIGAYILPIFILFASFLKIFNRGNQRLDNKLALIFMSIIVISTFGHLYYLKDSQLDKFILKESAFFTSTAIYFKLSAMERIAGGLVGGVIGDLLEILIGKIGSLIILVMISLSLGILITEQSLAKVVKGCATVGKWVGSHLLSVGKKGIKKTGEQIKIYNETAQKDKEIRRKERLRVQKEKQKNMLLKATLEDDKAGKEKPEKKKTSYKMRSRDPFDKIIEQEENELTKTYGEAFEENRKMENTLESVKVEPAHTKEPNTVEKVKPVPVEVIQTEIKNIPTKAIYQLPAIELMKENVNNGKNVSKELIEANAEKLVQTLESFGVGVRVLDVSIGPTVTRYELQPDQGVKVSKIVNLQDDIALNLAASNIRIEAPIPGKSAVGIEVPNEKTHAVFLREVIDTTEFEKFPSRICFALGKDIGGKVMIADIARMPHLLIAGATGSGKSVCVNTIITSILYRSTPEEVKLLMIDPKVVELSVYNGIPHLLIPVVTDPKKAAGALNWAVQEMSDRYKLFAAANVRDLKGYNTEVEEKQEGKKLPQIIIIVDELADLMMVAPNEVEEAICRLAQMARAAGIHLIIATQRPSVDVITGLIKANIPSRIAFNVSSGTDSRTIIDSYGAEKLLGKGDMLYYPVGLQKPIRVQGAFITDKEVEKIVIFLKDQSKVIYDEKIMNQLAKTKEQSSAADGNDAYDAYFNDALELVMEKQKASSSMIQRKFRVGFNRAARIVDQLYEAGFVGEEDGSRPRKVLMTKEEYLEMKGKAEVEDKDNLTDAVQNENQTNSNEV